MDHATLAQTIKDMQRGDAAAREQWCTYTDEAGGGYRDPAKHDEAFLQNFISRYTGGERFHGAGGCGGGGGVGATKASLADGFKAFQRKSKAFNELWGTYVETWGNGKHDPSKQSEDFMLSFIDFFSSQGSQAMLSGATPPAKKPRTGGSGGDGAWPSLDPFKAGLVERIKQFQRNGGKEQWSAYTDLEKGGVRDPAKHDDASLQHFIAMVGVP